jgi:hypothetical protein
MERPFNPGKSRRFALKAMAGALLGAGAARLGLAAAAPQLPHLTDRNPAAASLEYTDDTGTVDARKFPEHTADQRCANCKYFEPAAVSADAYAPCRLYPGNAVSVNGWCAGYASR